MPADAGMTESAQLGIGGLDHVGLLVDDLEASLHFYVDVLGLTVRDDRPELRLRGAWLDVGDAQLHLFEGRTPEDAGQHVALRVSDVDVVISRLERLDVPFRAFPRDAPPRQVIVHDPAGNRIELTSR
jgi:catechol 2,3-dioxygenase-like lactoylglutathione lyase family enzyme